MENSQKELKNKKNKKRAQGDSNKRLKILEKKCDEYLDGWKRAQADYQNLKKETAKWREDFVKFASSELVIELLDVYSNFKLAWDHLDESKRKEPWAVGFDHIRKQLWDVLERHGVEEIKTVGEKFDPTKHEAVKKILKHEGMKTQGRDIHAYDNTHKESRGKVNDDVVTKEVHPGFTLHGRIVRPAKVEVK